MSLKKKLSILVGITITGFVILGIMYGISNSLQKDARMIDHYVNQIDIQMLQARRSEKDFLLRSKESYIEKHHKIVSKLKSNIRSLETLIQKEQLPLIERMNRRTTEYNKSFNDLAKLKIKVGSQREAGAPWTLTKCGS